MRKATAEQNGEQGLGRALLWSALAHVGLLLAMVVLSFLLGPTTLELGSGEGGGMGEVISVGLSDQLSGGAGMYKPSIVPQPAAAPPPEPKPSEPETAPPETTPVFEEETARPKPKPPEPKPVQAAPPPVRPKPKVAEEPTGAIPRDPEPGSGGLPGGATGAGSGQGGGVGIQLGSGSGGRGIDSWYLRQLERRIAQNWLRTSLGNIQGRVQVAVSFEITSGGQIEDVTVLESSGIQSVDLSAQRAVRVSNPLPPLPPELRRRRVRFVARFEYPPR